MSYDAQQKAMGYYGRDWEELWTGSPYYGVGRPIEDAPHIPEQRENPSSVQDDKIHPTNPTPEECENDAEETWPSI